MVDSGYGLLMRCWLLETDFRINNGAHTVGQMGLVIRGWLMRLGHDRRRKGGSLNKAMSLNVTYISTIDWPIRQARWMSTQHTHTYTLIGELSKPELSHLNTFGDHPHTPITPNADTEMYVDWNCATPQIHTHTHRHTPTPTHIGTRYSLIHSFIHSSLHSSICINNK